MNGIAITDTLPDKKIDRDEILLFEQEFSKIPGVQFGDLDSCPLKHSFSDGVYVREIFIPKGMLIVGKIHKHSHPNFLMKGDVTVITEYGGRERLKGPLSMISKSGTKRVIYTHEDTTWVTVHITKETDLKKIEDEIIAKDYHELEEPKELKLEVLK